MKVLLNQKLYNCPESWSDITLNQFKNLLNLKVVDDDELQYMLFFLSIILDVSIFELEKANIKDLEELNSKFNWIIETKPSDSIKDIIIIDQEEYYFDSNIDKLGVGAWTFMQNKLTDGFWNNPELILSCLIRKVKRKKRDYSKWKGLDKNKYPYVLEVEDFDLEKSMILSEMIGKISIEKVFGISQFFFLLLTTYINDSHLSTNPTDEKTMKMIQKLQDLQKLSWTD